MATILVKHDSITPKLRQMAKFFRSPEKLVNACGDALLLDTRKYYIEKGGKFWPNLGGAFEKTTQGRTPRISIVGDPARKLLLKLYGGTVVPKFGKRMAIPTRNNPNREKWPSDYADSEFVPLFGKNGLYGLASAKMMASIQRTTAGLRGRARNEAIERLRTFAQMFTLVKSATHQPDPDALPPPERTMNAVHEAALDALNKELGESPA